MLNWKINSKRQVCYSIPEYKIVNERIYLDVLKFDIRERGFWIFGHWVESREDYLKLLENGEC